MNLLSGFVWLALSTLVLLWEGGVKAARLVDFQVAQPPPLPPDAQQCTIRILERTFAFSFGDAEVVPFTPPTDCGESGTWTGISLNFTVTSNGTQFDRLGIFTFQNVEIWRTSTPEPTQGDGIIWTYLKDVTRYLPLFAKPGTFILQLDNLIETGLDGEYATTLDATFFASSAAHPPAPRADLIVPISTFANDTGNDASVPPAFSNAVAAYAELYASGNGNEEFWYFNVANQFLSDLPSGTTFGQGPFREVRILVDGQVAGVAFPYAVIFTGGIIPTAWRPITSYGAIDLPTYFLDLTPFIPILTDGSPHNITLDVASAEADHTINQNWFVSGLLQVLLDSSSEPTTGQITVYNVDDFANATSTGSAGSNGDLNVTLSATRSVHIEADIVAGSGKHTKVVFTQELKFENTQNYLDDTSVQNVLQVSSGTVSSTHNGVKVLEDTFSYPFAINLSAVDASDIFATFDHSYERTLLPSPFILGSTIHERQLAIIHRLPPGGAFHFASTGNSGSNGTSNNTFNYVDTAGNTYDRQVDAFANNITFDHQGGSLAPVSAVREPISIPLSQTVTKARLPGGRTVGN
ncbi:hypothetical protein EW146_g1835 [Bondarzewia mesenterica]|uniref:Peptide N-acetyl-beta-D-glucosaminyl asparaginase amidase A N-terminal domain-containing protein n=1 Tax=Bondarzewia mesenterica TaxID=1095465 RepID=A0A4S4M2M7_9AGAM|nr:hypothetical protein EW146_g1835 [Bondarzewia mesenterica]